MGGRRVRAEKPNKPKVNEILLVDRKDFHILSDEDPFRYVLLSDKALHFLSRGVDYVNCTCVDKQPCSHIKFLYKFVSLGGQWKTISEDKSPKSGTKRINVPTAPESVRQYLLDGRLRIRCVVAPVPRKIPDKDSICAICLDVIKCKQKLQYCDTACGAPTHKSCSDHWGECCEENELPVTCVLCLRQLFPKRTVTRRTPLILH